MLQINKIRAVFLKILKVDSLKNSTFCLLKFFCWLGTHMNKKSYKFPVGQTILVIKRIFFKLNFLISLTNNDKFDKILEKNLVILNTSTKIPVTFSWYLSWFARKISNSIFRKKQFLWLQNDLACIKDTEFLLYIIRN